MSTKTFSVSGNTLNIVQKIAHQTSVSELEIHCWQMTVGIARFSMRYNELMAGKRHE